MEERWKKENCLKRPRESIRIIGKGKGDEEGKRQLYHDAPKRP
jgi:hypothetical protein